ncbi:hypothetical protein B0J14DRAFT_74808 [Halenospora varia]|nr:hypothetical protein B0J14DRAFT_74808 [Halenospora varia]
MTTSTTLSQGQMCHFTRLPLEIRRHIYRYVLLSPPTIVLSCTSGTIRKVERSVSILRVNRTISTEAVSLFYSELTILLGAEHILCLDEEYRLSNPNCTNTLWRHNPLRGVPEMNDQGMFHYDPDPVMEGMLEPHIFAQFRNVVLEAHFKSGDEESPCKLPPVELDVYDGLVVDEENIEELRDVFESLRLFGDLGNILASSKRVNLVVELWLNIDGDVGYTGPDAGPGVGGVDDGLAIIGFDRGDSPTDRIAWDMILAIRAARKRAVEVFIESALAGCFTHTRTIESFTFRVFEEIWWTPAGNETRVVDSEDCCLPEKHKKILRELKMGIESNFRARHGGKRGKKESEKVF